MNRHALSTRVWHWLNFASLVVLFMSGLNISNAHPWLYWGEYGFVPDNAWAAVPRFPGWATIPGYYSLAAARDWHILFAWIFALTLLFGWIAMLMNGHFRRDITTYRREWRWPAIRRDIAAHLRLDFDHGKGKYNFLQKVAYGIVLGILLPVMVLTGMGISPGWEPALSPVIELLGGRQSVRSIHFISAWALFAFFVLHVFLVLISGPLEQLKAMIVGGRQS
ncbi:cytochrome b/b6 domain-containing protein [Erythrobacter sp. LQ02-29]|uniref:cytochrome b/b6 domain-containing protein n=1 Tax=Erythrobacter sp. LQ02-29 TaxID=2920384 RepID=UPI001F4E452D|nr:cytochrome b/b6 domain-containing protein [Erythrobacter sp. LQ02-29]